MKKYLIAGLLIAGMASPALAAEYYVAQNTTSHKCSIVSKKPTGKSLTMLGSEGFKSKAAAESALKGMSEYKSVGVRLKRHGRPASSQASALI
jgi:hypothetical protein